MAEKVGIKATRAALGVKLEVDYREAVGLSRVLDFLNSDRGFCQITSFRPERGFERNCDLFHHLPQAMRDATGNSTVGGFWLIAQWVGLGLSIGDHRNPLFVRRNEPQHSLEYSWLLVQPRDLPHEDWFLAACLLAERCGQSAFIWRSNGNSEAVIYGAQGGPWSVKPDAPSMLSAMKVLTWLRAHKKKWGHPDYQALASQTTATSLSRGSAFAVHPALEQPTHGGPEAITLYAAKPHCISSQMFFAALQARSGG